MKEQIDFNYLGGSQWADLLSAQPQFADKCDWDKLWNTDWAKLLAAQPQFADKCDWDSLSLHALWHLFAKRPELRVIAKEKRFIPDKICSIAVVPKEAPYELARSVLEHGKIPIYDPWGVVGADASATYVYADGTPGGTELIVRLDGETLVKQEIDFSNPRGLAYVDRGNLFDETPPKSGQWLYGANPREDVRWSGWVFGVAADCLFNRGKLVIPFVRGRTSARDEPQRWIHPCDIRYGDLKPGDDGFRTVFRGDNEGYGGIDYWTIRTGVPEEYGGPWYCSDAEDDDLIPEDDDLYPADTTFPPDRE